MSDVLQCPLCERKFHKGATILLARHVTHEHLVVPEAERIHSVKGYPTHDHRGRVYNVNYRCLCGSPSESWQGMSNHLLWFDCIERHLVDAVLDSIGKVGGG